MKMFLKCELFNILIIEDNYMNLWLHNVIIRVQIMAHLIINKCISQLFICLHFYNHINNYFYFIEMWWSYISWYLYLWFLRARGLYFIVQINLKFCNSTSPLFQGYPYYLLPFWLNICLFCTWFWRQIVLIFRTPNRVT